MAVIGVIQARWGSTRFAGKVLADVAGVPMLRRVIERTRKARMIDRLIVATAGEHAEAIVGHAAALGVDCFIGDPATEEDVLHRFVLATRKQEAGDWVIRICGDNPLIVPSAIDELVAMGTWWNRRAGPPADYVGFRDPCREPPWIIGHPTGYFAELIQIGALQQLDDELASDDPYREHVTMGLWKRPGRFWCVPVPVPMWYHDPRVLRETAVDTPDDLARVVEWIESGNGIPD